jgi:Glycosyl transferase family 2
MDFLQLRTLPPALSVCSMIAGSLWCLLAYNAETTLLRTVAELDQRIIDEIVLVDDACTDQTIALARNIDLEPIRHERNLGCERAPSTSSAEGGCGGTATSISTPPVPSRNPQRDLPWPGRPPVPASRRDRRPFTVTAIPWPGRVPPRPLLPGARGASTSSTEPMMAVLAGSGVPDAVWLLRRTRGCERALSDAASFFERRKPENYP